MGQREMTTGPYAMPGDDAPDAGLKTTAIRVAAVAVLAFLPVIAGKWVNWDDDTNFLSNPSFRGLGWQQIAWAWRTTLLGVYQPLSWMFLEGQYCLWGLDARGYHAVSLGLHAINSVVLFFLCRTLVRIALPVLAKENPLALNRSAGLAAALFAAHPLRAEVVSWVSCQPYLPSALLVMLAALVYLQNHDPGRAQAPRMARRGLPLLLFALAMSFKAVAVSLPVLLLILDVYPLRRLGRGRGLGAWWGSGARKVWLEKIPFALLGGAVAAITISSKPIFPASSDTRVATVVYSVWFYPAKTLWPVDLAAVYGPSDRMDMTNPVHLACAAALVAFSLLVVRNRRFWPALAAAWAVYLTALTPNAGFVNIAPRQIAADRYSYLASIGFVALGAGLIFRWSCGDLRWRLLPIPGRGARRAVGFAGLAAVGLLCVLSWRQSATWHDSEMLWAHAAEHGQAKSVVVQTNLGLAYADIGRLEDSLDCFKLALNLLPHAPTSQQNYARALAKLGFNREAIPHFREAIRLKPDFVTARNNLALTLLRLGDAQGAEDELNRLLRIAPNYADAHNNLGLVLLGTGRKSEAVPHFAKALRLQPGNIHAAKNLELARDAGDGAPGKS